MISCMVIVYPKRMQYYKQRVLHFLVRCSAAPGKRKTSRIGYPEELKE
jgi:hypothetical protein